MAAFEFAFDAMMRHEDSTLSGIITDEPNGGRARFGINSVAHPEVWGAGFFTMERCDALAYAAAFYKREFFEPIGGFQITDQSIANKFFDLAVNEGITQSTKIVQRAVNRVLFNGAPNLMVDGKPGMHTIDAINLAMPGALLQSIKDYAVQFYKDLAASNPKFAPYLSGWLARANS